MEKEKAFLDKFLNLISSPYQSGIRNSLSLSSANREDFDAKPLSRNKYPALTYKITLGDNWWWWNRWWYSKSFVVKFAPPAAGYPAVGSWYDVKREYDILKILYHGDIPVPRPIYQSTSDDERTVGTSFIIMEYVEGQTFIAAGKIPSYHRSKALQSVMGVLSKLHGYRWGSAKKTSAFESSEAFWDEQVTTWKNNWGQGNDSRSDTSQLFSQMKWGRKPSGRKTGISHGDMNISNVIFDSKFNVKAIIDWKYGKKYGDPMSDVAYFMMMFLNPTDYGIDGLYCYPLTIASEYNTSEDTILGAYKMQVETFDEKAYNYAKAVACLRLISIYKNAQMDGFRGHELGSKEFKSVTGSGSQHSVLIMLIKAGQRFYAKGSY